MFPNIKHLPYIALDTETTGLNWWKHDIFGFSVSVPGNDWYFDIRHQPESVRWLKDVAAGYRGVIIGHNIKFDTHFLRKIGVDLRDVELDDTVIMAALLDEHMLSYDLDAIAKKYLKEGKTSDIYEKLSEIFGGKPTRNQQAKNFYRAPTSIISNYAKTDTNLTLRLWLQFKDMITQSQLGPVYDMEKKLLKVLIDIEYHGVNVNVEESHKASNALTSKIKELQYKLDNLAGFEINPNPSKSIHQLFSPKKENDVWILRDGTIAECTPAGAPSIDNACLRRMADPCAGIILSLRKLIKTRDTFINGHVLNHHHDGIIHANFNQTRSDNDLGTITGRLSVNSPALQQIHKRDQEIAPIVRSLFIPDGGCDWVCNDWAQMDFRVFAHYVNDKKINDMYRFNPDTDFHKLTADMTGLPRSPRFSGDPNAKQINLGLIFGMGMGKLAAEMGLPHTIEKLANGKSWIKPGDEAMVVFDKYHQSIPGVSEFLKNASSVAKSRGYVRTIMGRRIRFPNGQFTHKAGGLIFQGSAADALKLKLIEVHDYLRINGDGARLLLNVHDEFDISVPRERKDINDEISKIVTDFVRDDSPIKFRIPIRTDQGCGPNWWEACK